MMHIVKLWRRSRKKESEVQRLQDKYEQDMKAMREEMNQQFKKIMSMVQKDPLLAQVKPEAFDNKGSAIIQKLIYR